MVTVKLNDLARHHAAIQQELKDAISRVVCCGHYVLGQELERFEEQFASFCGVKHAVGVANGTEAIELALRAVGIRSRDTVITVANAGYYATTSILAVGARPAFADVDLDLKVMTAETLKEVLTHYPEAKAVVATHLYGQLADSEALSAVTRAAGIPLIEDCAQAHGAKAGGHRAGSVGLAGCFSFYPTKNLGALGDAGAIVTQDDGLAKKIRSLRQYGWEAKYNVACSGGRNSRLDEIQAAVISTKLSFLDLWNTKRREIAREYSLSINHPRVICPKEIGPQYVAHLYVLRCMGRGSLRRHLQSLGVASDIHYPIPDHKQVPLQKCGNWPDLPITEKLSSEVLTLPCFPEMTSAEIGTVIAAVNEWPR